MNACKSNKSSIELGIVKDSCLIKVVRKQQTDNLNTNTSVKNFGKDTMLEFVISFQTQKDLGKLDSYSPQIFGMEEKFLLKTDTGFLMPVFCQPIATGNSKKFTYLVSFEADKNFMKLWNNEMIILENSIIGDSVHYKL